MYLKMMGEELLAQTIVGNNFKSGVPQNPIPIEDNWIIKIT